MDFNSRLTRIMSVEGGSVGGVGGGVAVPVVVNEGPVRSLEGFKPMNASDINTIDFKGGTIALLGEIIFKQSIPSVLEQAEAVAAKTWEASELNVVDMVLEAEAIITSNWPRISNTSTSSVILNEVKDLKIQARDSSPAKPDQNDKLDMFRVQPLVLPWTTPKPDPEPALTPATKTGPEPAAKTELSPKTGTRILGRVSPAVSPQPLVQEQEVEEEVLEKVQVEEPKASLEEEEEIEKTNKKFVVDERALSQVVLEIKAAIRKAGVLAGELGIKITGGLIGKFLPGQHQGNESEAVKGKGPDGSIPERQQIIEGQGEYISVVQAEAVAVKVAYEKPPIKIRPEGESVKDEVVEIVFRGHVEKPKTIAVEMIRKRFVKKQVQSPVGQAAAEPKTETNEIPLEELSPELAEVFQKAA